MGQRIPRFAIAVALLCLCATTITLYRSEHPASFDTAAEHWATAIVHAQLYSEVHFRKAMRHFNAAIVKSAAPCDVLVSYGDFLSGPSAVHHETEVDAAVVLRSDDVFARLENIAERMKAIGAGFEGSLAVYSLAAESDPSATLPRFRLAVHGDASAAHWLTHHDPSNALGPYLEAAHTSEADTEALLSHAREATLRARLAVYPSPIPTCDSARYPAEFGEYFGRRVPQSVLSLLIYRQEEQVSFLDPLPKMLCSVVERLYSIAKDKNDARSIDALLLYNDISHLLAFNDSGDLSVYLIGIRHPHRELVTLLNERFSVSDTRLLSANIKHQQVSKLRDAVWHTLFPRLEQLKTSDSLHGVYSGSIDLISEQRTLFKQLQQQALVVP